MAIEVYRSLSTKSWVIEERKYLHCKVRPSAAAALHRAGLAELAAGSLGRSANQVKMENEQNRQGIILIALTLFLVITGGCRSNTTQLEAEQTPIQVVNDEIVPTVSSIAPSPTQTIVTVTLPSTSTSTPAPPTPLTGATLVPASTLPPRADTQSTVSILPELPTLHEFIPRECMEEQSKAFIVSPDDPKPTYFVDERWVILPLRICTDSYGGSRRSDYNWLFSIQINAITTADGRPLHKLPKLYLRYRRLPDDSGYIRGNEGAVYAFRYEGRTNKHHVLGAGDRGIYDLVFEFEDTDGLEIIPGRIDFTLTVDIWFV